MVGVGVDWGAAWDCSPYEGMNAWGGSGCGKSGGFCPGALLFGCIPPI